MPVLTQREMALMRDTGTTGTAEEIKIAEEKLNFFQKTKTFKHHISAINYFIPGATEWAQAKAIEKVKKDGGKIDDYVDRFYHRRMNALTKAARLRV
jgi:hypothetical protein